MSDHAKPVNDRVDLGHRLFLAGFFVPLVLGSATAIIGFGLTTNVWIPVVGLVNFVALILVANILHQGNKTAEKVVMFAGVVLLIAGLVVIIVGQSLATSFLGEQLMMPAILAAAVAAPATRVFFASQRHEVIEAPIELSAAAVEVESILVAGAMREEAKSAARTYSLALRAAGAALVLVAIAGVVLGVMSLMQNGTGWSLIFAALFSLPAAPVLLTLGDRWSFLATTKGYEKTHLANIAADSQTLVNCASTSVVLLALLAIIELAMR